MVKKIGLILLVVAIAAFMIISCKPKKKGGDVEPGEGPTKTKYVSKNDEGTVTGVIKFDGTPPTPKQIDMSQDANCAASASKMADDVLVEAGKLQNVFVYVKGGPSDKFDFGTPSDPVVLDQHGCRYSPRVLGLQAGQTLKILNSDATTHNVHPSPRSNAEWNQVMSANAAPLEKKFSKPETLIPVKCNQHPWMLAHIGVLAHPFFSISAKDGAYTIKGLPPGDYTLVAYHETLGEKSQKITVGAKESKTQDFSFSPKTAAIPTSLEIGPALVLP